MLTIYKTILSYYFRCRKTESKNPKVTKTNKKKIILLSKYGACHNKKLKVVKKQKQVDY